MKKHYNLKTLVQGAKSLVAILMVTLMAVGNVFAQTQQYQLVNENQTDWSGTYLLVSAPTQGNYQGEVVALHGVTTTGTTYGLFEQITTHVSGDAIATNATTDAVAVTIAAGSNGGYTIYQDGIGYYGWNSGNSLRASATATESKDEWTFTIADGELTIANVNTPTRHLQFNAQSPRFAAYGNDGQTRCKLYKLGAAPIIAVAAPTFTLPSGNYFATQTVTIEGPAGATIYYTVDGTDPTTASIEYTAPIEVATTVTIKAIAVIGTETSHIASVSYNIRIPVEVANIAAFKAAAGNDIYKITGDVKVLGQYSNKYYTFVQDATGALYIYGTMANAYNPGDVISGGVYGTYDLYNGLAEMKPVNGLPTGAGTPGTPVDPVVVSLSTIVDNYADYESKLVTIENVTIAADRTFGTNSATRGVNITQGTATAQIYNTLGTITGKQVHANDVVNVTGYVIRYSNTIEIVPRSTSDIVNVIANLPYTLDFDNVTDDGFMLNNGTATNKWFIGQASGFDNNKLFITSNNGSTNKYENVTSTVKATRRMLIPTAGATLTFDYRVMGNANDNLKVSIIKNNNETILGTLYGSNDWMAASLNIEPALAGDVELVFTWTNNASVDNQFPAAIDNISVVETSCMQPTALTTTVNGTTATISWTAPADQNIWTVEYKHADHSQWHALNTASNTVTLAGLDGNTMYDVRVKANCGAASSAWTAGQFTIDCQNSILANIDVTIGTGSTTNSYLPFYGLYNYAYSQQIYDASELNIPAGPITAISFDCSSLPTNNDRTGDIRIWMANTTKSTFANNTDYIDPATLTEVAVISGMHPFVSGWNTFTLDQPFMYDGTSNLVVAYYEGYNGYASMSFHAQSTTDNKSIAHYSDTYASVSYTSPATAAGSKYFNKYRNDIKLVGTGLVCNDQPACAEPENLTLSDVANTSATVAWTAGANQNAWVVEYKAANASNWNTMNVTMPTTVLAGLTPATDYTVRVATNCGNGSYSEYVSTNFSTLSACMEPTALTIAAVNGTTVDVAWTPRGNETSWMVQYKKTTENTWISVPVNNAAWATLSGLSGLTDYNVRVKAVCGAGSESEWITANFTTGCETKQLPYEEGFEDYATQTSDIECWAFINNNGYSGTYPKAYVNSSSAYIHTGSRSLYFQSAANESVYAILPALSGDDATLSFWYRNEGTTAANGVLSVGYLTNETNENTFVTLQTLPQITTMTKVELNVGSLAGKRLAFKYEGGTSNNYYLGIDDINVVPTAHCLNPEVITVSNIQTTSADVVWTPRGDGSSWEVEYGPAGFSHGAGTTMTTTTPSISLSGLTEGTAYELYVRSICAQDQSDWSDVVTFTTSTSGGSGCDTPVEHEIGTGTTAANTIPFNSYYHYSRNETIYPQSELGGPCLISGIRYYSNATASLATSNVKIYLAVTENNTFSSTSSWTPAADLTLVYDANNVTLGGEAGWQTFNFDVPFFYAGTGNLVVCVTKAADSYNSSVQYRYTTVSNTCLYRQNDSSPVNELTNTNTGTLSGYRANAQFITCPVQVTCPSPVVSSNIDITAHSISLSWTPGGSETQWEVSYTVDGTTNTFTTTNTSLTIGNLDAATVYTIPFSITAVCSATDQSFPVNRTLTFMTECDPTPMLYTEDFDNLTTTSTSVSTSVLPNCWTTVFTGTSTSYGAGVYYGSTYAHSDLRCLRFYQYLTTSTSTTYGDIYVILPEMDIDLDLAAISFQARRYTTASYSSMFKVGIVTDVNNPAATFTPIQTIIPSSSTYQPFTVSLEGHHTGRIAFFMDRSKEGSLTGTYNYAYIDDIEVYPRQVTCPNPVLSTNVNVTNNAVTVHWTPGGSETSWEVTYTLNGTTTTQTTTTPSYTINGLTSATEYTIPVSVVAVCSATDHSFASNRTFTFETECDPLALPYNENFDSYTTTVTTMTNSIMPDCWKRAFTGTSASYGASIYYNSSYANSDARCLRLYNYCGTSTSTSYGETYAILPALDIDLDLVAIDFQARRHATTNYSSVFQVGIVTDLTDLAGSFIPVDTIIPSGTTYEPFTVSFEGHHTGYIAFFMNKDQESGRTGTAKYAFIDDIQVYQAVFTRDLNLISVENIEDNCDLSDVPVTFTVQNDNATADVTSFRASYSVNGGTPVTEIFTPTALASGQQATFTFTQHANLTAAVNSVTVTLSYSGDGNSANDVYTVDNINLITPFTLPYSEDFTNVTMGQGGWIADARNDNPLMWTVVNGTPTYTFSDEFNASSYMVSPCISIPAGQYMISYDYNALGLLPENMTVYVATSPAPADWTVIEQHQGFVHTAIDNHVDYIFNNTVSGVYYIVVKAASPRGSVGMTFDNLRIAPTVNVTVNTDANGTSVPNGNVTVASGSDLTIHLLPNTGYHVASISVNGTQVMGEDVTNGNVFDFTLTNVTAATTVDVTFAPSLMTVRKYVSDATPFGHFVPVTPQVVAYGGDATITVVADPHYHMTGLYVSNYEYNGGNLAGAVDVLGNTVRTNNTYTYQMNNIYHDKSVLACFRIDTMGIFYTVYGQGVVENQYVVDANTPTPAHFSRYVDYGSSFLATFVPAIGYHVESIIINGVNFGGIEAWDFANISEDMHVVVNFAPNVYTVTTHSYGMGTVTPGATFIYDPANTYNFAATPIQGYRIASVLRNSVPMTVADPESTFTDVLTNILDNYVYEVTFAPMDYNVTATSGNHGQVSPTGVASYHYNQNGVYTITADLGYYISSVTVDGNTTSFTQANAINSYTHTFNFAGASAVDHTISATFAPYQYTITVNAAQHGTITPGTTTYNYGQSPVFAITPDPGYGIDSVKVDGNFVGAVDTFMFPALTANHTLSATFAQLQYTIMASAGLGGTITPVGTTNLISGGSQTYAINPATGYHIENVYVDGVAVGAVTSYSFSNVTANHIIFAAFAANEYTVTVNQPSNGVINPGTTTVAYGATPTFVVTPNIGFRVSAITLNGTNVISQATNNNGVYTYTLPAVTANSVLTATMVQKTFTITATAGANGVINGPATVNYGATATYTITPANGYVVDNVVVDGMNMGAITTYTFVNVVANHTISVTFRPEDCDVPFNMHTTNITTNSATFSWYHPVSGAFEVQYKPVNSTTFTTAAVNGSSYAVANLLPSTTYVWMVRANCGNNNYSEWSNGNNFRTQDEPLHPGVEDRDLNELVNVYASHNNIYIVNEYGVQIDNVQVYDMFGQLIYSGNVTSSKEVISMNVAIGTYMVRIATPEGSASYKVYLTR